MGATACSSLEKASPDGDTSERPSLTTNFADSVVGEEQLDELDYFPEDSSSATDASGSATGADLAVANAPLQRHSLSRLPGSNLEALAAIDDVPKYPDGVYSFNDLARPYAVFREGLFANREIDVRVRIGPVIGKVTDTSVIILLEVDTHAEVAVNIARIYEGEDCTNMVRRPTFASEKKYHRSTIEDAENMLFSSEGSCTVSNFMEAGKPSTFEVWGLEPAASYLVILSNVSNVDMDKRLGRFRTMPRKLTKLKLAAISGNRTSFQAMGSNNPWRFLQDLSCAGPDIQLVLHVGHTIDVSLATTRARDILIDFATFKEGIRKELERQAREFLRDAFATAWGHEEGLRRCLAEVGSHLPIFSPPCDIEEVFRSLYVEGTSWKADELRAVLRTSLDVYYEYQRALWNESASMTNSKAKLQNLYEQEEEYDDEFIPDEYIHRTKAPNASPLEEWHFHKYGRVGVFMLDTKGNRFQADGVVLLEERSTHRTCPLISDHQWAALKEVMLDQSIQVLLIASDAPFFAEDSQYADKAVNASREPPPKRTGTRKSVDAPPSAVAKAAPTTTQTPKTPTTPQEYPWGSYFDWCSRPREISRLLSKIFEWKHEQYPNREAVLISGSTVCGTSGNVWDHELGLSIPIVLIGPTRGAVSPPQNWSLCGSISKGRFSYVYRPPLQQCNFCTISIELQPDQTMRKPAVEVQMVQVPAADYVGQHVDESGLFLVEAPPRLDL